MDLGMDIHFSYDCGGNCLWVLSPYPLCGYDADRMGWDDQAKIYRIRQLCQAVSGSNILVLAEKYADLCFCFGSADHAILGSSRSSIECKAWAGRPYEGNLLSPVGDYAGSNCGSVEMDV